MAIKPEWKMKVLHHQLMDGKQISVGLVDELSQGDDSTIALLGRQFKIPNVRGWLAEVKDEAAARVKAKANDGMGVCLATIKL